MTAFLWTYFVLGSFTVLCRAILVGSGKTTHTTPAQHLTGLLVGIGFLVWAGVLLRRRCVMIAEATPNMECPFQSDHAPLELDLHVVRVLDADRNRGESREPGRLVIEARLLEAEPQRIYGFRLRDAYLHVPVSDGVMQAIAARVGRAGVPGRREGGKIWGLMR